MVNMIRLELASLAIDSRGDPVVILRSADLPTPQLLPIWIGVQEANAIMFAVQGATAERPLAYDLMARLLETLEASVSQIAITKLEEGTYYAEITLRTAAGEHVIDARPSDSVALALRTEAPIFVAEEVLEQAGVVEGVSAEEESEIEEFTKFLEEVDPEDFRG